MQHKRNRTSLRKPSGTRRAPDISANHKPSSLDIWLSRGSHIAQVGLFILTIAALFYTVIPLYKTAALEEQIARREAELKAVETKLGSIESALTEANGRAYQRARADVLWNLAYRAGPKCSGLFDPLHRQIPADDELLELPDPPLLELNVAQCLKEVLAQTTLDNLKETDRRFLTTAVADLGRRLEMQRAEAHIAIGHLESKPIDELEALAPKGPFLLRHEAWQESVRRRFPQLLPRNPERERKATLRRAQEKVATDFEEQVRIETRKLREIIWPHD